MAQKQTPGALGCNEGLGGWVQKLKRRFCSHSFAIEDLEMVNRDSDGADRVAWPCSKCSKVFRAHCGLDISPTHGPTFRREPLNAEFTWRRRRSGATNGSASTLKQENER